MSRDYYLHKRGLSIYDIRQNENLKDIKITKNKKDSYWLNTDDAELLAVCVDDYDDKDKDNDIVPIYFFTAYIGRGGEKILKRIAKAFDGVEFIDDERIEFLHNEEKILVEELMKKILNE